MEDDQIVEMEAQGQDTEFVSDLEEEQEGFSNSQNSSDDEEVVFNTTQENNNASKEFDGKKSDMEEGECSDVEELDLTPSKLDPQASKLIEEKIDSSMSKVKDYFEGKFNDLSRVMELEKQLAENKRHLEELKSKGKTSREDDTCSELTLYKNCGGKGERELLI